MEAAGRLLRAAHLLAAVAAVVATVLGPRVWVPYLFLFWLLVLVVNVVAGGCPVTRLEMAMTGEDVTVADTFLLGLPTTKRNRDALTIGVSLAMLLVSAFRY